MKRVIILLSLGVFLTVSCVKNEQESQVLSVRFTPCQQTKATNDGHSLLDWVEVEFTSEGVKITYYNFGVTCDFNVVNVTHTFVNGVLNITQQGSPCQDNCICYTDVSYTISGILQDEVIAISINGVQVYWYDDGNGVFVPTYEFPNGGGCTDVKLWKNGVSRSIEGISYVTSVFVSDNDVYVAGFNILYAMLWKNGKTQVLDSYGSSATSVFVSDGDEYVAGYGSKNKNAGVLKKAGLSYFEQSFNMGYKLGENTDIFTKSFSGENQCGTVAKLWKNGVAQELTDGTYDAMALSVYVSGSDEFVAGREYNAQGISVAKLWKNGTPQDLTDGYYEAWAKCVFVSGDDVYVAGYEHNAQCWVAKLWKNGVAQNLTGSTRDGWAHSVFVSGNDVYVAGTERNAQGWEVAKLWKNGVAQNLTNENNIYNVSAEAHSVHVSGNDVYVAGFVWSGGGTVATLWKNGVAQNLAGGGDKHGYAYSVFVK